MKAAGPAKVLVAADASAVAVAVATFFEWLPNVAALLTVIWVLLRLGTAAIEFYEAWRRWRD